MNITTGKGIFLYFCIYKFLQMNSATQKKELIRWISSIDNQIVLDKLDLIKQQEILNFDDQIKNAISGNELKKLTTKFISSLDWKK